MLMTVTVPPYFSFRSTAACTATRSYGFVIDSTPERMSVFVSGSIFTSVVSGTCLMQDTRFIAGLRSWPRWRSYRASWPPATASRRRES